MVEHRHGWWPQTVLRRRRRGPPRHHQRLRRIEQSEVETCAANGIEEITEVKVGYDGIVLANSKDSERMSVTVPQIWMALAKEVPVDGEIKANPYQNWSEIDPSLPDAKIEVLGPPPTSGTRDAFVELVMEAGCQEFEEVAALDEDRMEAVCATMREDGAFVEAGENDNLIVQKIEANPDAFGIFGFSFLDQNLDMLQGSVINDEEPTFENIADGAYPVSRSLYFYVKNAHVGVIPGIKEYVDEFTSDAAAGEAGYLSDKGLIPLPEDERAEVRKQAISFRRSLCDDGARTGAVPSVRRMAACSCDHHPADRPARRCRLLSRLAARSRRAKAGSPACASKPGHYAWYVALLCAAPALALWFGWLLFGDVVLRWIVESRMPADVPVQSPAMLNFFFDDVRRMAAGLAPNAEPNEAMDAAAELWRRLDAIGTVAFIVGSLALAAAGVAIGLGRIEQNFRAPGRELGLSGAAADRCGLDPDHRRDRVLGAVRSIRFFERVPIANFLFGLEWSPQTAIREDQIAAAGSFGAVPLFTGTLLITCIAMLVAGPIGPLSAIYLSEYAPTTSAPPPSRSWRSWPACRPWSMASSPR